MSKLLFYWNSIKYLSKKDKVMKKEFINIKIKLLHLEKIFFIHCVKVL